MYNPTLLDHFQNPRNVGRLEHANGIGFIGDPGCGDYMCIFVLIEDWRVKEISFLCKGCPASIASASATTELAKDKLIYELASLSPEDVAQHLGGMPEEKLHCSNLGVAALGEAMRDYLRRIIGETQTSET
jgi:nitrogen fixation NifU-like protein